MEQRYGNLDWLRNRNTSWPKQSPNTIRLYLISSSSSSSPTEEKLFLKKEKKRKASQRFSHSHTSVPAYEDRVIAGMREDTASEESSAAGRPGSRTRRTRSTWKQARWPLVKHEATHRRCHCAGNVEHYPPARHRPAAGIRMGHMETGRMFQLGLPRCDSNRRQQCSQSKSSEGNNFTARLDGDLVFGLRSKVQRVS